MICEVGKQRCGLPEGILQLEPRLTEEGTDLLGLLGRQTDVASPRVYEEAVPRVGRDATCARMRLVDVSLVFQGPHVVADRGRRDPQLVAIDEGLRANRLARAHVVRHDGT